MDDETAVAENRTYLSEMKADRRRRHQLLVTELFLDFSKNTTLHGLRYVTQIGLSIVEKLFWFIMFVISVVLCFILIQQVWHKWCDSPIIVTINERMISVEEVLFPSVTICPQMKIKRSEFQYEENYKKYVQYMYGGLKNPLNDTTERTVKMLDDALLVCDYTNIFDFILRQNTTDATTTFNIEKIAPTVEDTFFPYTSFYEEASSSNQMFNKVLTRKGVCFTFNTIEHTDMFKNESIQHQYFYLHPNPKITTYFNVLTEVWDLEYNKTVYPRRGRNRGTTPDLVVELRHNVSDDDGICNAQYNGYEVYLHHPDDLPQTSLYYHPVSSEGVTSLAVKFNKMITSESLMKYSPDMRQCYFPKERELRYFKTYTPSNCRLDCLSIYTYKRCGCVPFYMPHSNSSEICTAMKRYCVNKAEKELTSTKSSISTGDACNCLPSCNTVQYDADVRKINYELKKFQKSMYNVDGTNMDYSRLEVYFKEPRFVAMRRSELFGLTDFLANCGGLLGLFLGFSFLSIVEIIYYCTLRLWYTLKTDNKAENNQCNYCHKKTKNSKFNQ